MASTNLGKIVLTPKGSYNTKSQYERLDIVEYEGNSYLVLKSVKGVTPVEGENYHLLAGRGKNIEFKWSGTQLGIRVEGEETFSYQDLKGPKPTNEEIISAVLLTPFVGLETTAKTLVDAVNEVKKSVPNMDSTTYETLTTDDKTLIGAINELNSKLEDILSKLSTT